MAKRLLLVNDSVAIREVVELTFENSEINTRTAAALEEALEAMRQESADIIIADADRPNWEHGTCAGRSSRTPRCHPYPSSC